MEPVNPQMELWRVNVTPRGAKGSAKDPKMH